MRLSLFVPLAVVVVIGGGVQAQSVSQRLANVDGRAELLFPSRPDVCGDGHHYIDRIVGSARNEDGNHWRDAPCVHGPVRVVVTVMGGEPTRLSTYVGPVPRPTGATDLGTISAEDATVWLRSIVLGKSDRVATEAMVPLMVADAPAPWPLFLQVARDSGRGRGVRGQAMFWLGQAAAERVGVAGAEHDEDDVRASAVFALSQQPRETSVPQLLTLARSSPHKEVRANALFWLGQSRDPRATELFAEMLGLR